MWHWFQTSLQNHPELAIFLTLALGFFIGKLSFKSITLGAVTGTLLAGVLVGQLDITIPDLVKTVAFIGFLFALGYRVGPQFFAAMKKDGIPQLVVAVLGCLVGLGVAYAMAKIMGYGPGWGAGLLAGGLTQSAVIGVATDAINASTSIPDDQKKTFIDQIPVGYAVCYLFGTAAAAYFLSQWAPKMLGTKDLAAECSAMEKKLGTFHDADSQPAYRQVVRRTYRVVEGSELDGVTVRAEEELAASRGRRIFLQRYRRGDELAFTTPDTVLRAGDVVTVTANHSDFIAGEMTAVGSEVDDSELLGYDIESLAIVLTRKELDGKTLAELAQHPAARNLFVKKIVRAGIEIPFGITTVVHRGDEITVEGPKELVEKAIPEIGKPNRSSDETDYSYVGLGIFLGGLIGIPTIAIAGAKIGLTTSGGALIMGLIFGWLRSRNPTFGKFPPAAEWLMDTGGLCMFVGIVGIQSGPNFISGVKSEGVGLLFAGLVVTLLPMLFTLFFGKLVYKWPSATNIGATAGTFTTTASIGAVCDAARSKVPVLGYTVPYAIGNTLLTIWGTVIVALLA
ncbi:putative transport protein [Allocatelliglobosispora scoriae]|uniref:Putative transport protein n=1 Tax=Allocatelliglobosispora scoriae TaxID=643052 RepID=A0A841C344_9ACTN|nr:aspartate-alanine antiporter [Allocatelliglobosispora scoriae]MBB5873261.1 putative transport protein [Allocatelliglobosispora scoriae]